MTRYDRLLVMSAEEIADKLHNYDGWINECCSRKYCASLQEDNEHCDKGENDCNCKAALINWLKEEI